MKYTVFVIIIIIILLLYMRLEASLLKKNMLHFCSGSKGLKLAHISDIHINMLYITSNKLLSALDSMQPDIIIMTGDYIEKKKNIPKFIALLKEITDKYPVYLTFGNHDHNAFKYNIEDMSSFISAIEAAGATVLLNSNVKVTKNNKYYNIIGIDDLKRGRPNVKEAFKDITSSSESGIINIAFSHNPDMVLNLPEDKVDYFLCGHFHGGQIWMPFHLEFRILRREKLCKLGYRRGLHKINGINVYINRGMGNVIFPFRFFSVPEIAVIQLP